MYLRINSLAVMFKYTTKICIRLKLYLKWIDVRYIVKFVSMFITIEAFVVN